MSKPKREKKPEPLKEPELRVLPTQLRIGDRIVDESGEWEVLARPYTTGGGKIVNVRVHRADNPNVMAIRVWGAHERVSVNVPAVPRSQRARLCEQDLLCPDPARPSKRETD